MIEWNTLVWVVGGSAVMFLGSILVAWILVIRMPSDYLNVEPGAADSFRFRHPLLRAILVIARNVIGVGLLLTGLIMLVTPGQGILFMFLGLTMIDFPRKHDLIRKLLSGPKVMGMINRIRQKAGKPLLEEATDDAEN